MYGITSPTVRMLKRERKHLSTESSALLEQLVKQADPQSIYALIKQGKRHYIPYLPIYFTKLEAIESHEKTLLRDPTNPEVLSLINIHKVKTLHTLIKEIQQGITTPFPYQPIKEIWPSLLELPSLEQSELESIAKGLTGHEQHH